MRFSVHNYALRGSQKGFTAEIEFDGQLFSFDYAHPVRADEFVEVATVYFDGKKFKLTKSLPSTKSSKAVWGVSTMQFIPVTTLMRSPNFWNNQAIGNKHYFFMLENCVNQGTARGFFNEFLSFVALVPAVSLVKKNLKIFELDRLKHVLPISD